jgi:5'-3' exoribonuclease 1
MGIPYYFSYLIQKHRQCVSKLETLGLIHNLFIDSNSIIYDSLNLNFKEYLNKNQYEDAIIKSVLVKLEEIIATIKPQDNIYIAFDGVPPFAKINQQKNRRYKTAYQNKILKKESLWDSCAITPGTIFMANLNSVLKAYFVDKKYYNNSDAIINVVLSLSDEHGEGEHKLFAILRQNNVLHNKTNVLYGMDSDLFMLSLNHLKYTQNIFLYRETPLFISSLDKSLDPKEKYIININILATIIYFVLTNQDNCANKNLIVEHSNSYYNKIEDYIFICFLLGNDFLPHFPAINIRINGFTILLELYKKIFGLNEFIINNGSINWHSFKKYIKQIAENEEQFIKEVYNIRDKQGKKYYPETSSEEIEYKFTVMPSWDLNIEHYINPFEEDWQHRYYYSLCSIDSRSKDYNANIKLLCTNYLETLQWVYYYYSNKCKNWTIHYKYHYPPLLCDLYTYIPYFNSELTINDDYSILNTNVLLAYVLPKHSLHLLPENIHNHLLKNYDKYYKDDYALLYAFCKYFYEGHVDFPEIQHTNFNNAILKLV